MKDLKYSYDFEFLERGHEYPIQAISLGVKCEDGRTYYAVFDDFDFNGARGHDFVGEHVMPYIPMVMSFSSDLEPRNHPILDLGHPDVKSRFHIKAQLEEFYGLNVGLKPELWGYYADYDHVLHSQIWGNMVDLPEAMPMYTRDIKQEMDRLGKTREDFDLWRPSPVVGNARIPHHALHDAEEQLEMVEWISTLD